MILLQPEVASRSNIPMLEKLHTFAKGSKEADNLLPSFENLQGNYSDSSNGLLTNQGIVITSDKVTQVRNNRQDLKLDQQ